MFHKHSTFISAAFVLGQALLMATTVFADTDPFQRHIRIHNSLNTPIYPVIQAPQDAGNPGSNCGTGGLLRIVVNQGQEGAGIPPGGAATVAIPKDRPCARGGFYDAVRVYVLNANFTVFEKLLNENQRTKRDASWSGALPCPGCWVGTSGADYGHDAPGQLLEYTIISQNPATGNAFPNPNDTHGTSLIDFDVSYVDDAYLPVAMGLGDGGATQYMGSSLNNDVFKQRLSNFLAQGNWSRYAAWSGLNWATPSECPSSDAKPSNPNKTTFSCLVPRVDRVPSANILIANAQTGGVSGFYLPSWNGKTPQQCNTSYTSDPKANKQCSTPPPNGAGLSDPNQLCCPNENNVMLGCCDQEKFLIDNTSRYFNVDASPMAFRLGNDTLNNIVKRFKGWQGAGNNPCNDAAILDAAPVIDKRGFCEAFKRTVDYLWKDFAPQCPGRGEEADRCITSAIIGYYVKNSKYNPDECTKCPNDDEKICPRECALEAQRNESTQAIQRGLPWTPSGEPKECGGCPSTDPLKCPSRCIMPEKVSPSAKLYHHDKFLHFWADYPSTYNLNPFARFVHNEANGLAAQGAYSFSIDDFYGNFGGPGSTLIIDVGGTSNMQNREPFDPYKQYRSGLGTGWHHATVCGRNYSLPASAPANVGLSAPISFWSNGEKKSDCEVRLFPTADESKYVAFKLEEVTFNVVDSYTGKTHGVQGLSGVYASRFGDPVPADPYCTAHSTVDSGLLNSKGLCRANLSAGTLNLDYVGVSNEACKGKDYDATCGKPLVNLNIPSFN